MASELSATTRNRRDAIFAEFRESGRPLPKAVFERVLLQAQLSALETVESRGQVALPADRMHFYADAEVWLSRFPDRSFADFRNKYPMPGLDGTSCPEYEPYRARVLAKKSSAGEPTTVKTERPNTAPEANKPGRLEDIPDELWPEQGFEGMEDLGIAKWIILLPKSRFFTAGWLLSCGPGNLLALWSGLPLVVHVSRDRGIDFLMLRYRASNEGAALPKRAVHEAWMDLVGWFHDLHGGGATPLPYWVAKAVQTRADAVQRDASSLRRVVHFHEVAEKVTVAMGKFRALGMLAADRDTGGYPPDIIGNKLEDWWVKEQLAATGLDEARHRNVGWWVWHSDAVNGTSDGRRPPNPAEAQDIERLYRQREIGAPIIEDEVRRLLERTRGPFGHLKYTLEEIEHWVKKNEGKLPLSPAYLHRMAVRALHRMVPSSSLVLNHYVEVHLPAAAAEFLNEASSDLSILRPAMAHWVKENPDGHPGSLAQRAEGMTRAWAKKQVAEQDAVTALMAKICIN